MPITELDMSKADMERAVRDDEVCGQCGGRLNIAYIDGGYVLRCPDLDHDTITRHRRKSDYEKENEDAFRRVQKMDTNSLMKMDEKQMLSRIEMAKFPQDLTPADRRLLAQVAISYGFDPLMGEVSIYQGRPYVSIDGRYRKAQESGKLDGVECRPATRKEREDWEIPEGDYFFHAEVRVKDAAFPFVGWGRVYAAETMNGKGFKPVEKNPQRMAEKRAEAQALRKAFHIPLPSVEDIGSPEENHHVKVDVLTGELIQGQLATTPDAAQEGQGTAEKTKVEDSPTASSTRPFVDSEWLQISLKELQWADVGKYLHEKYGVSGKSISERVAALNRGQATEFVAEVQKRLKEQGK